MTIKGFSFCSMNLQLLCRHYLQRYRHCPHTICTIIIAIFSILSSSAEISILSPSLSLYTSYETSMPCSSAPFNSAIDIYLYHLLCYYHLFPDRPQQTLRISCDVLLQSKKKTYSVRKIESLKDFENTLRKR